jgi:hypothetical protein
VRSCHVFSPKAVDRIAEMVYYTETVTSTTDSDIPAILIVVSHHIHIIIYIDILDSMYLPSHIAQIIEINLRFISQPLDCYSYDVILLQCHRPKFTLKKEINKNLCKYVKHFLQGGLPGAGLM